MRYAVAIACSVLCILIILLMPVTFIGDFEAQYKAMAIFNAAMAIWITKDVWDWARR